MERKCECNIYNGTEVKTKENCILDDMQKRTYCTLHSDKKWIHAFFGDISPN